MNIASYSLGLSEICGILAWCWPESLASLVVSVVVGWRQVSSFMWIHKKDRRHNSQGVRLLAPEEAIELARNCNKAPIALNRPRFSLKGEWKAMKTSRTPPETWPEMRRPRVAWCSATSRTPCWPLRIKALELSDDPKPPGAMDFRYIPINIEVFNIGAHIGACFYVCGLYMHALVASIYNI